MSKLNVVAYAARSAVSAKTGKPYVSQLIEIQQAPERPNASFMRFYKNENEALAPGFYKCSVGFYTKGNDLVPSFTDFEAQ